MYAADLAYINCLDEFDDVMYREVPEYAVPAFRVQHPWNKLSNIDPTVLCSDFILVAEFSELEGPRPLITIPNDGAGNFNLNDFAVRIMSVDQNTSVTEGFHITEDFQVILTETRDNVFAFVHHFVLYDQQARGFVRPFAVCYVTADQRKLMYFYEEIAAQMKKVARYFKYGNKLVFRNDLEKYLKDLEFTKRQVWRDNNSDQCPDSVMNKIKQVASLSAEVQNILTIIRPMLTDKRMEQRFARMEEKAKISRRSKLDSISLKEWDHVDHANDSLFGSFGNIEETVMMTMSIDYDRYKPKFVSLAAKRKFDIHLRGLHELCSWGAKDGLQKLRRIHQFYQRDMALLQEEKLNTEYLEPVSGLLTFGNQCLAANFMAKIDKICVGSVCCRLTTYKTETTPKFFLQRCSSNDTLESFKSLTSSFQSIPDDDSYDNVSMTSAYSDIYPQLTETTWNSKEMVDSSHTLVPDNEFDLVDEKSSVIDIVNDNKLRQNTDLSENENGCENSDLSKNERKCEKPDISEIDKTENTDFSENSRVFESETKSKNDEQSEKTETTNLCENDRIPEINIKNKSNEYYENLEYCENERISETCSVLHDKTLNKSSLEMIDICDMCQNKNKTESEDTNICDKNQQIMIYCDSELIHSSLKELKLISECDRTSDVEKRNMLEYKIKMCQKCQIQFSQPLLEEEDSPPSNGEELVNQHISGPVTCEMFPIDDQLDVMSSGFGLRKLLTTYNNMQPLLYSLLTGRTVLIVGTSSHEADVKSFVKALRMFVPTYHRYPHSCIPWSSSVPKIVDLTKLKLVGLCRPERKTLDRLLPNSIKKLVTIMDVEKRVIHAPSYQGAFINTLIAKKKVFKVEEVFLSFVQS